MTNRSDGTDGLHQGVQAWLRSMESSRQALEDLGRTMGQSMRAGVPLTAADLERAMLTIFQRDQSPYAFYEADLVGDVGVAVADAVPRAAEDTE